MKKKSTKKNPTPTLPDKQAEKKSCHKWSQSFTLGTNIENPENGITPNDVVCCKEWKITGVEIGYDSSSTVYTGGDETNRSCKNFMETNLSKGLTNSATIVRECNTG